MKTQTLPAPRVASVATEHSAAASSNDLIDHSVLRGLDLSGIECHGITANL